MSGITHIREALRWTPDEPTDWASMAAAAIGMAVPLALAAAYGDITLGDLARNELKILATLAIAAAIVAVIADHGAWSYGGLVLVAGAAAVLGGYSRQLSVSTGRFIVFFCVIFSAATGHGGNPWLFALIGATALWTSALIAVFGAIARHFHPPTHLAPAVNAPKPTHAQLMARWRVSMRHLKGWQFPLRLVICLGLATIIAAQFPNHRYFWIAVTVALVCQRPLEPWPLRTTQRTIGTLIGVGIAAVAIIRPLPDWALVSLLGILCGLRLGVRTRNYLAFSALMTPVIMLILDAGHPVDTNLLVDRVSATLIGAGLVVIINRVMAAIVETIENAG